MDPRNDKRFPWEGSNVIFDGNEKDDSLNLFKGTYAMLSYKFEVMIRKQVCAKMESYDLLRNFRHENAMPLLNYYIEDKKHGHLVIPKVHSSFQTWFEAGGKFLLFDEIGHMTNMFETMIIEFCSVVESLIKQNLILKNFIMDNMYVNVFNEVPTLCILITEVKKVQSLSVFDTNMSWDCVRKFITWCEERCNVTRDHLTECFCTFIEKSHCKVQKLKKYPHNWDDSMKGQYLMSLVAAEHSQMRYLLSVSGMSWPYEKLPRIFDNLPSLLRKILDWEEENDRMHNTMDFFSYIILLRNCYKHYKELPKELKNIFINRRAIIEQVEVWIPDFWIKIYERIGWP